MRTVPSAFAASGSIGRGFAECESGLAINIVANNVTTGQRNRIVSSTHETTLLFRCMTEGRVFNLTYATAAARVGFSGSPPLPLKSLTMASISEPSRTSRSRSDSATL